MDLEEARILPGTRDALGPRAGPAKALFAAASRRLLVLALFLIGLSLSRGALKSVGWRPLAQGALRWVFVGLTSLVPARGGFG